MLAALHDSMRFPVGCAGPLRRLATALLCATACSVPLATALVVPRLAMAQQLPSVDPEAKLLLQADRLIYDNDNEIITAEGNVQLDYDGYNVVARRVTYNQRTRRVKAFGNVEILEPDGNKIFAQEIDLTDDFSDGFVNALRIETPDETIFAAESAQRLPGDRTIFNQGVYTACKTCPSDKDKPPLWQIKAKTVVVDGVEKTVTYRDARFEFFGKPIAYLPYFRHATPDRTRRSGFIIGQAGYEDELGLWYRQPYFWATGDTHDVTIAATGYTRQGVLLDGRFRHQLENGRYEIRAAGIKQQDRLAFRSPPDRTQRYRGMLATNGRFVINPRWAFGWDVLAQNDENFSRTYSLRDYNGLNINNEIYLRGLHDRSYFNLSAHQYLIQEDLLTVTNPFQDQDDQALVRPLLDYNYVTTTPRLGAQLSLDVNVTSLQRGELNSVLNFAGGDVRTHGFNGNTTRVSTELGLKKTYSSSLGFLFTPSLTVRGDWLTTDGFADPASEPVDNGTDFRFVPTAGLEVSYPLLVTTPGASHIFEPLAQIFVRPDLSYDGVAPNEDAQSLVFDASTLFSRDKFSGYDRMESGTRANIGLRYSGQLNSGLSLHALIGQSFHLGGENPYAREDDLTNTGEESGLETARSDYVAAFGLHNQDGLAFNVSTRWDENDFDLRRGQATLSHSGDRLSLGTTYAFIDEQPDAGFVNNRHQIGFFASYKFDNNWSVFGSALYDFENSLLVNDSIGIAYDCDCFNLKLSMSERRRLPDRLVDRIFQFSISLRTLGDFNTSISPDRLPEITNDTGFDQ